ncbi:hypothetical protein SJDPG12_07660 [Porphyromonas gingivalis SJD12]|uniref:DUF1661 domain-containing protein n=1 Tax=Porphyromonas gingivalis TaxID=837 RepID=UPI000B720035|nr:hypothetical protein SJDPG12_07660 [Porphyromonas gingivalis SJD12]
MKKDFLTEKNGNRLRKEEDTKGREGCQKNRGTNRTSRNSNRKSPKSQTKIPKKWRENLFVPARDFFNSRAKTKIFSDHVLQPEIHRIFQTGKERQNLRENEKQSTRRVQTSAKRT